MRDEFNFVAYINSLSGNEQKKAFHLYKDEVGQALRTVIQKYLNESHLTIPPVLAYVDIALELTHEILDAEPTYDVKEIIRMIYDLTKHYRKSSATYKTLSKVVSKALKPTSDLAKDVAETVLEYLTKHIIGQLCTKIVIKHDGATNNPGISTKCVQALPYKMQGTNLINWRITIPMHENMGSVAGGGRMVKSLTPACEAVLECNNMRSAALFVWKHMHHSNTFVHIVVNDNGPHQEHVTLTENMHHTTFKTLWIEKLVDMMTWCQGQTIRYVNDEDNHNIKHEDPQNDKNKSS